MASRAVIIGPANYAENSGLESHREIYESARCYGEVLGSDRRWGSDQVTVLPEDKLGSINDVMDAVQAAADATTGEDDTLLVIYVGHGAYWDDVPGAQVHFAVNSARAQAPFSWLSSWYVYRAMRKAKASLKVLIADCCNSNFLPQLSGTHDAALPGVLGEQSSGSCVLAAVKDVRRASPVGCDSPQLDERFRRCTPFSGHLLNVLSRGTEDNGEDLTLGMIHDALRTDISQCVRRHDQPRMILNDARERMPLFSNRMDPSRRTRPTQVPGSADDWAQILLKESNYSLDRLFNDPETTGEVVARLSHSPHEAGRRIALRVNERADKAFRTPDLFARYWEKVAQA
jgi:hypothetical protein